jgi:Zn ribbon nucleic-acid-binding protein
MESTSKKKGFLEKAMAENLPQCPFCKSDKGYEFSGLINKHAKCKQCGAKWWIQYWRDYKVELVESSRDGTGSSLLDKAHPFSFWQKLNVDELLAEEKRKESVEKKGTFRDTVFIIVLSFFLLNVFLSIYIALITPWSTLFNLPNQLPSYLIEPSRLEAIYRIVTIIIGILSSFILLMFANWLSEDETRIKELEKRVSNIEKTESKQ